MTASRREVPEGAFDFAREHLWLARGLTDPLQRTLVPAGFDAWAVACESVPASRLGKFASGGPLFSGGVAATVGIWVATAMVDRGGLWIVPDGMARPSDPYLERETNYAVVGDAVYYVCEPPDATELAATWRRADSAVGQCAIVASTARFRERPTVETLREAGESASLVVLTAYDGDGLLFFERRRPESGHRC